MRNQSLQYRDHFQELNRPIVLKLSSVKGVKKMKDSKRFWLMSACAFRAGRHEPKLYADLPSTPFVGLGAFLYTSIGARCVDLPCPLQALLHHCDA